MALSLLSSGYGVYADAQVGSSIGSSTTIGTSTPKLYFSEKSVFDITSVTVDYDGKTYTLNEKKTFDLIDCITNTTKLDTTYIPSNAKSYTRQDTANYDIDGIVYNSGTPLPAHLDVDLFTLTQSTNTIYAICMNLLFTDDSHMAWEFKFNDVEDYNKFIQLAQSSQNLTTSDLLKVKKYLLGVTTETSNDYDLNGDGKVTSNDLLIIKKVLLGLA